MLHFYLEGILLWSKKEIHYKRIQPVGNENPVNPATAIENFDYGGQQQPTANNGVQPTTEAQSQNPANSVNKPAYNWESYYEKQFGAYSDATIPFNPLNTDRRKREGNPLYFRNQQFGNPQSGNLQSGHQPFLGLPLESPYYQYVKPVFHVETNHWEKLYQGTQDGAYYAFDKGVYTQGKFEGTDFTSTSRLLNQMTEDQKVTQKAIEALPETSSLQDILKALNTSTTLQPAHVNINKLDMRINKMSPQPAQLLARGRVDFDPGAGTTIVNDYNDKATRDAGGASLSLANTFTVTNTHGYKFDFNQKVGAKVSVPLIAEINAETGLQYIPPKTAQVLKAKGLYVTPYENRTMFRGYVPFQVENIGNFYTEVKFYDLTTGEQIKGPTVALKTEQVEMVPKSGQ